MASTAVCPSPSPAVAHGQPSERDLLLPNSYFRLCNNQPRRTAVVFKKILNTEKNHSETNKLKSTLWASFSTFPGATPTDTAVIHAMAATEAQARVLQVEHLHPRQPALPQLPKGHLSLYFQC